MEHRHRASRPSTLSQVRSCAPSGGQTLVEYALVAILFFTLFFGVIEFGRLFHSWATLEHAVAEAGRYASPGTGHDAGEGMRESQVRDVARAGAASLVIDDAATVHEPGYFAVTVRSSRSSGNPSEADDAGGPNDFVRISILYNHPVLTFVLGRTYIPLRSEALVLNERYARPSGPAGEPPPGGGLAGGQLPATPRPTWTPSPTPTPKGSPTATPTPTITPTPTVTPTPGALCYTLSTAVSPADGGTISVNTDPNCSGGRYTSGTQVSLRARPGCKQEHWWWGCIEDYRFDHWSGDASGANSRVTVTMDGNRSVTAHYE